MKSYLEANAHDSYNDLNEGNVTDVLKDRFEICSEVKASAVTHELQKIIDKILIANKDEILEHYGVDVSQYKPTLLLSLNDDPNAFTTTPKNEKINPVLVVTRGLLNEIESEDELAGVLAHEIHHYLLPKATKQPSHGHLSECACDIFSVSAIRKAGYQPSGYAEFYNRRTTGSLLESLTSSHPSSDIRLRHIETAISIFNNKMGRQAVKLTPLPSAITEHIPQIQFEDEFIRILQRNGFNNQNTDLENLTVLVDCLLTEKIKVPRGKIYDLYGGGYLTSKIIKILNQLKPQANNQDEFLKQLALLRDWIIRTYTWNDPSSQLPEIDTLFSPCANLIAQYCDTKKDHFYILLDKVKEFVSVLNRGDTLELSQLAKDMIEICVRHYDSRNAANYLNNVIHQIIELNFPDQQSINTLTEGQTIKPCWDAAVQVALKEFKEDNSTHIANVLDLIGIDFDPRLTPLQHKFLYPHSHGVSSLFETHEVVIDEQGQFFNPYANSRLQQEATLLQKMNWQELQEPPVGIGFTRFVKKYEFYLQFDIEMNDKIKATDYLFAKKFIEELKLLPKEQIQKIANGEEFDAFLKKILHVETNETNNSVFSKYKLGETTDFLSLDHPYVIFLMDESASNVFFSNKNKFKDKRNDIIEKTRFLDIKKPTLYLQGSQYSHIDECKSLQDFINAAEQDRDKERVDLEIVLAYNVWQYLLTNEQNIQLTDFQLLNRLQLNLLHFHSYGRPLKEALNKQLDNVIERIHHRILLQGLSAPINNQDKLENLINIYIALNTCVFNVFSLKSKSPYFDNHLQQERNLLAEIVNMLNSAQLTPNEKKTLIEKLIFNSKIEAINGKQHSLISYTEHLQHPELRQQLITLYTDVLAEINGKDNGSHDQEAVIMHFMHQTNLSLAKEISEQYADKITAQHQLAFFIKHELEKKAKQSIHQSYIQSEIGFRLINVASHSEKGRTLYLDFLLKPFNEVEAKELFINTKHLLREYESGYTPEIEYTEDLGEHLKLCHKIFWLKSDAERALIFKELLYSKNKPPKHSNQECKNLPDEEIDSRARQFVLNKAFKADAKEERKVVEAYLASSDHGDQSLLLSLILASQNPNTTADLLTTGRMLKIVLMNLGPAGIKMAQAINSHPDTPLTLKQEMRMFKFMADKPTRWDLYHLIEECCGERAKEIAHVDDILGAGAYGVTVAVRKKNGSKSALTLLRPYAEDRAASEFTRLQTTANHLYKTDPNYAPAEGIVRHATRSSQLETDMKIASQQNTIAQKLYNEIEVKIGVGRLGKTYMFTTAAWISHSDRFKETAIVPGKHFLDLPEETIPQKIEKRIVAIAILTVEFHHLMSGYQFDHDRHGAQQRIFGTNIGGFDFGGVSLTPPTLEQKKLLGKLIARLLNELTQGNDLITILQTSLNYLSESTKEKEFLASVRLAILALNEYLPYVDKSDLISIFSAIRKTMDNDIANTLGETLSGSENNSRLKLLYAKYALSKLDKQLLREVHDPIKIILYPNRLDHDKVMAQFFNTMEDKATDHAILADNLKTFIQGLNECLTQAPKKSSGLKGAFFMDAIHFSDKFILQCHLEDMLDTLTPNTLATLIPHLISEINIYRQILIANNSKRSLTILDAFLTKNVLNKENINVLDLVHHLRKPQIVAPENTAVGYVLSA